MKLLISRGVFERLCAGQSPVVRAELAELVTLYPDDQPPPELFDVDDERIGAAFEKLIRDQVLPAPPPLPFLEPKLSPWPIVIDEAYDFNEQGQPSSISVHDPEAVDFGRATDAGITLPPPWEKLGPGVWSAPAGTPPPWLGQACADSLGAIVNDWQPPAPSPDPLGDLRAAMDKMKTLPRPRPRRLEAGDLALIALTTVEGPAHQGWMPPGTVAALAQVPIVRNGTLPAHAWRLVDPDTDEVLLEGTIGATIEQLQAVVDEAVDQLAEEYGIPRNLLDPWGD